MGTIVTFPLKQNEHVNAFQKLMNESGKKDPAFDVLLDYVASMEKMMAQSNKNIADMRKQLSEIMEIQKHPIKAELHNLTCAIAQNADAAKSWLEKLKERIVELCKNMMAKAKDMGTSALDKTITTLKIKDCLDGIANSAAKENALSGKAIKDMENFATSYHKAGRAISNMGRALIGKEPIDGEKQKGKLLQAMTAPHRANKSLAAKIERTTYRMSKTLDNFHTREQIKRLGRQDADKSTQKAKPVTQVREQAAKRTPESDFARMKAKQSKANANKPQVNRKRTAQHAAAGIDG